MKPRVVQQTFNDTLEVIARAEQRHVSINALVQRRYSWRALNGAVGRRLRHELGDRGIFRRDQQPDEDSRYGADCSDRQDHSAAATQDREHFIEVKLVSELRLARRLRPLGLSLVIGSIVV